MSIDPNLLFMILSAGDPFDDTSVSGGAAGLFPTGFNYLEMNQLVSPTVVNVISNNVLDVDDVRITGRDDSGDSQVEDLTMNGTTPVVSAITWSFIQAFEWLGAGITSGTILLRTEPLDATIASLDAFPKMHGRGSMFKNSFSDAILPIVRFEKLFWRNVNSDLLASATITLVADPSSKIKQGISPTKDDSQSIANRLTIPPGITFVDDNIAQNIPTGGLNSGENIGVWQEESLGAGDAAVVSTFSSRIDGQDLP